MQTKSEIRQQAKRILTGLENRPEKSEVIWNSLQKTPEFQNALLAEKGIVFYADFQNEVETRRFFPYYLEHYAVRSPLVVPYCKNGEIHLFRLKSVAELEPQTLGIPEPRPELRGEPDRTIAMDELGLVLVPGLAFDLFGHRLGRGAGYYDRFLAKCRNAGGASTLQIVAVAFDAQIVQAVPHEPHDVPMDTLITETQIRRFTCTG